MKITRTESNKAPTRETNFISSSNESEIKEIQAIDLLEEGVYSFSRKIHLGIVFLKNMRVNLLHSVYQGDLLEIPHTGKDQRIEGLLILVDSLISKKP